MDGFGRPIRSPTSEDGAGGGSLSPCPLSSVGPSATGDNTVSNSATTPTRVPMSTAMSQTHTHSHNLVSGRSPTANESRSKTKSWINNYGSDGEDSSLSGGEDDDGEGVNRRGGLSMKKLSTADSSTGGEIQYPPLPYVASTSHMLDMDPKFQRVRITGDDVLPVSPPFSFSFFLLPFLSFFFFFPRKLQLEIADLSLMTLNEFGISSLNEAFLIFVRFFFFP